MNREDSMKKGIKRELTPSKEVGTSSLHLEKPYKRRMVKPKKAKDL